MFSWNSFTKTLTKQSHPKCPFSIQVVTFSTNTADSLNVKNENVLRPLRTSHQHWFNNWDWSREKELINWPRSETDLLFPSSRTDLQSRNYQNITRLILSGKCKSELNISQHRTVKFTPKISHSSSAVNAYTGSYAKPCSKTFLFHNVIYQARCSPLMGKSVNPQPIGKQDLQWRTSHHLPHSCLHWRLDQVLIRRHVSRHNEKS